MLIMKTKDVFVLGMFAGMFFLCVLMLAIPKPSSCEVKMMYDGGKVSVVRFGVVKSYNGGE